MDKFLLTNLFPVCFFFLFWVEKLKTNPTVHSVSIHRCDSSFPINACHLGLCRQWQVIQWEPVIAKLGSICWRLCLLPSKTDCSRNRRAFGTICGEQLPGAVGLRSHPLESCVIWHLQDLRKPWRKERGLLPGGFKRVPVKVGCIK